MNFKRIYAIYIRSLFLFRHNLTRLSTIFVGISVDIILWGFITKYLTGIENSKFSFASAILGAIILWDFLVRIQQGVMVAFLEDVYSQNFLNLFGSPLTVKEYLSGLILISVTTGIVGLAAMLLLAGLIFGYSIFILGLYLFPFFLILFLFALALGIFTAAIIFRFGPSAEWLTWPIAVILAPLAGVYYPISTLPAFLQLFAKILPPSYVFEGMRGVLFGGTVFSIQHLLIGAVLAVLYIFLSYFFFVRVYKFVLRTGLISRFGAESA